MHSYAPKAPDTKSPRDNVGAKQHEGDSSYTSAPSFEQRPAAVAQRKLQAALNESPKVQSLIQLQKSMNQSPRAAAMTRLAATLQSNPVVQRVEPDEEELQIKPEPDALLRASAPGDAPVQRTLMEYQDKTGKKDMNELAKLLSGDVDSAKAIVDMNPLLTDVPGRDAGYLAAWVTAFTDFTSDKDGKVPAFFYARYGYAIETIATSLFKNQDHKGYKVSSQATYGSTRPDFVIQDNMNNDIAWLDITSSASTGHIYNKQGGGWTSRPYVAEIVYDMPAPTDFANTAKGSLSEEQLKALQSADQAQALREAEFDKGMKAMGLILGEAFATARRDKGSGLSKSDVKQVTINVTKEYLDRFVDKGVTQSLAAGVLASIASIEVAGGVSSGLNWANWAFGGGVANRGEGRALLWDFGKPPKKEEESDMKDEKKDEKSND